MTRYGARIARTFLLAALAACGGGGEAAAENAEVAGSVEPAAADVASADQEVPRLDDRSLEQWFAAGRAFGALARERPDLAEMANVDEDLSDAEKARRWEAVPELRAALEGVGLSALEYLRLSSTIAGSMMGTMLTEAQRAELSPVERDNIAFLEANAERIQAFMEENRPPEGP